MLAVACQIACAGAAATQEHIGIAWPSAQVACPGGGVANLAQRSASARPQEGQSNDRGYDEELPHRAVAGIALMRSQTVGGRRAARTRRRSWQSQRGNTNRGEKDEDTHADALQNLRLLLTYGFTALQALPSFL